MHTSGSKHDNARKLLDGIWRRNTPLMQQRLALLDEAAAAALARALSEDLRRQAANEAHNLAGSLGMFGYPRGTDIAREIELLLETSDPADPQALSNLSAALRHALFPETPHAQAPHAPAHNPEPRPSDAP
jgi:HPt (histidine-containing phosphotransfer) domain-containing protein